MATEIDGSSLTSMDEVNGEGRSDLKPEAGNSSTHVASRTPRKKFVGKRTADALAAARKQESNGTSDAVEDTSLIVHNGISSFDLLLRDTGLTCSFSTVKTPTSYSQSNPLRYPRK